MEKLKQMKEALVGCVQGQVYGNLQGVDTKELGEAIDMIKDLSEAIYYCTITEAMEEEGEGKEGKHGTMYYPRVTPMPMYHIPYPVEIYDPRSRERSNSGSMYAQSTGGNGSSSSSNGGNGGSQGSMRNAQGDGGYDASERGNNARGYQEGMVPKMYTDGRDYNLMYAQDMRDPREGRSGQRRRMYMEGKGVKDKTKQMQELEGYMQELSQDLTEMIQDASPEEKQMLQQKISTLATKIK